MKASEQRLIDFASNVGWGYLLTSEFEKKAHAYELYHKKWLSLVNANETDRWLRGSEKLASAFGLNLFGLEKLNELSDDDFVLELNLDVFKAVFGDKTKTINGKNILDLLKLRHKTRNLYGGHNMKGPFFGESKMTLRQILEQEGLADRAAPQFNESEIIEAFMSEEPYVNLKRVFDRDFFPKVIRWVERKIKEVEAPENAEKMKGGEFGARLGKYLDKDKGEWQFESNAEMMARELLNSIDKWNDYEIKPKDLPDVSLPG